MIAGQLDHTLHGSTDSTTTLQDVINSQDISILEYTQKNK